MFCDRDGAAAGEMTTNDDRRRCHHVSEWASHAMATLRLITSHHFRYAVLIRAGYVLVPSQSVMSVLCRQQTAVCSTSSFINFEASRCKS